MIDRSMPRVCAVAAALLACVCCGVRVPNVVAPHATCPVTEATPDLGLGAITEPMSALRPTELSLGVDGAAVLAANTASPIGEAYADRTDWLASGAALARVTGRNWSAYGALDLAIDPGDAVDPTGADVTRVRVGQRFGSGARLVTEIDQTYQRGFAVRVDVSHGTTEATDPKFVELRPMDVMRMAIGWQAQAMIEMRYELLGCFAPFLHLTAGARRGRARSDHGVEYTLPISVAIGAHREVGDQPLMLIAGYDADVVAPGADRVVRHRLRFGIERLALGSHAIRVGADVQILLGNDDAGDRDGAYAGLTLAVPFARGGEDDR